MQVLANASLIDGKTEERGALKMDIDVNTPDRDLIARIGEAVRKGGVILYPTDTVYGLGCDPYNTAALEKIIGLKGRESGKGMLLLVPGREWISRIGEGIDADKLQLCSSWWPGPVTCLFQANPGLPPQLTGKQGKIGVRIPDNRFLLEVMSSIPGPLVSTSANPTGEAASGCFSKLDPGIISGVDLWIRSTVDHESGNRNASTVVDLSGDSPEVVREGEGIELVRAAGV